MYTNEDKPDRRQLSTVLHQAFAVLDCLNRIQCIEHFLGTRPRAIASFHHDYKMHEWILCTRSSPFTAAPRLYDLVPRSRDGEAAAAVWNRLGPFDKLPILPQTLLKTC